MSPKKTWTILALLISMCFVISNATADDEEFDFRFDDPADGEGAIDPETTIDLKVTIENYLTEPREYELYITNDDELESNGLEAWWSNDGEGDLSAESTSLPSVDVADGEIRNGITVTVRATENAVYGTYSVSLKCRDKDNSEPEANKQVLDLTVNVDHYCQYTF